MKLLRVFIGLLVVVVMITGLSEVQGEGECGIVKLDEEVLKLVPCASAVEDETAPVSKLCCKQVEKLRKYPECLCAILLSDVAKESKISPEIAMTIPKRCNIIDRPVGYQCGDYTLP